MSKSSTQRRADVQAALKHFRKAKDKDVTLDDLALLWGVTKARFLNVVRPIPDWPEPKGKRGNQHIYDAVACLESLLAWETRNDQAESGQRAKIAKILGRQSAGDEPDSTLPPSEILKLARARAEIEERLIAQGHLHLASECEATTERVYSIISAPLGNLAQAVDPNARLPASVRETLLKLGRALNLRIYDELRDMLGGDVDQRPSRAKTPRKRTDRARRTAPSRKRQDPLEE